MNFSKIYDEYILKLLSRKFSLLKITINHKKKETNSEWV